MQGKKSQTEIIVQKQPSTLVTQHNIAYCLQNMGNYDEALVKYNEMEKSLIINLGHKH